MKTTLLFIIAAIFLAVSLGIKCYGLYCIANKNIPEEERMARYKKTMPITYGMLFPAVAIIIYLLVTK